MDLSEMVKHGCVYENDEFVIEEGRILSHVPAKADRGMLVYAYAVVNTPGCLSPASVILSKDRIDRTRKSSRCADDPNNPWNLYYEKMAEKTALRIAIQMSRMRF